MRYEDASHTGAFQGQGPIANDDSDQLAAGSKSTATGNLITGDGTQTGSAGADVATGGHITAIAGKGGEDSSFASGKLSVMGEFGKLSVDAQGNYVYQANKGVENVRDRFTYTLADNNGATDTASLVVEIGKTPFAVKADAQQIVVGPDGVVTLPAGVELSDVHIVGRNLVVDMPDGTQLIIIDGAVFVPQLVLNGVEVPATNVAALLIGQEVQPAAGETPPSSGGNFAVPPPPLDPGVPLGDLIPPTEYVYQPPEPQPPLTIQDSEPEAGVATALLDDDAQQGGNPLSTTGDDPGGSVATGNLPGSGGDGDLTWALTGGTVPAGLGFTLSPQLNGDLWILQGGVHVITVHVNPVNGDYTVTQIAAIDHTAGGNENNEIFTINYSVTDEDGDTANGTLTIDVDDDMPTVNVQAGPDADVILTTDDAQTIGAASDTAVTTANFSGVFGATTVVFGADGVGGGSASIYALAVTGQNSGLTSHGAVINLFMLNGVVVGTTGGQPANLSDPAIVFTVSTTNTGIVTLTQFQQIDHAPENPSGAPFNDQFTSMVDGLVTLTRSETAVDGDGDSVTGSATVNIGANLHFTDDGPTIGLADHGEPNLTVDETTLGTNDTQSFAANFAASFGADGPAANAITYALGISAPGVASGLIDSLTNQAVVLNVVNGQVVGTAGAGGPVVFTVSVDANGNVTLDQSRAVIHSPDSGPDQSTTLSADNLVTLTATAHDFDGDTASATINIGTNLNFEDDAPDAAVVTTGQNVSVDETAGIQGDSNDTSNAAVIALFAGVANVGSDPDMLPQYGSNALAIVGTTGSSFGADGPGTAVFSLDVSAPGVDSGLDTTDGHDILLFKEGNLIVGRVDGGADDGKAAFAIAIDPASGVVSMVEYLSIDHPVNPNPDDSLSIVNGAILATVTVTDKDGDSDSSSTGIGSHIQFQDDGPTVTPTGVEPQLTVDETVLTTNDTKSFGDLFDEFFGADGPASSNSKTFALGINIGATGIFDTATGLEVVLTVESGSVVGRAGNGGPIVFVVSVDAAGDVTVDQQRAVIHPDTTNPDDSINIANDDLITLSATVTDGDGDTATATIGIGNNIHLEDDGPSANNDTDATDPVTNQAVGNVITGVGTIEGPANADQPHADGFGAISNLIGFGGSSDNNPAGGFDVNGQFGTLHMDVNGNYTYTRNDGLGGGQSEVFTYTYVDGDGDPATATLTINIADNAPTAGTVNVGLDDDALAGGNPGGTGDDPDSVNPSGTLPGSGGDGALTFGFGTNVAPAGFTYDTSVANTLLIKQGATTVLTITINPTTGAYTVVQNNPINHVAGLDENNQTFAIDYTVKDIDNDTAHGTINISVDDDTPTVSANAGVQLDDDALAGGNPGGIGDDANATNTSGTLGHSYGADGAGSVAYLTTGAPAGFSYALQGNGDLWVMQGATHVLTLTVNATTGAYTVVQVAPIDHAAGLDENNVAFTINYRVTDHDGDTADGSIVVNVDDDTPTVSANAAVQLDDDALAGGNPGGTGDVNPDTANTSGTLAHSYGADGAGSTAYLTTGAPAGFSYALQGNGDLWIMQGAVHVITLTVNASTGAYTVTQVAPIDHAAGLDENDVAFTVNYRVTDHDGDTADGSIVINVDDDTPTVSANAGVQLDDDALAGGNAGGIGDDANATNTSGTLAHSYGADGPGAMAYLTTGAPAGFSYALQGNGDLWVMQGATHVLTLTINATTGAYTVTQVAPIDHAAGLDENNVAFTISYSVTDHDGDSATGSIVVNVDDDTPTVSSNAAVQLDDESLAGGIAGGTGDVNPNTANTSGTLAHSYGADGAGSTAYLTTGAPAGFSYALQGNGDLWVMQGAVHVITLTVNASTGAYTVTQVAPILHPAGGDENDVSFTVNYRVTDHDGDTADGSIVINVDDDSPNAAIGLTGQAVIVDESVGIQVDSNDTTNAGVIALFAGVANKGTDTDLPQYAQNAGAIVNSTGSAFGADGAGTTVFSLSVVPGGVDSGLDTTAGVNIFLFLESGLVVGRVGATAGVAAGGPAAFAIAIDPSTGVISMVEYLSINHPNAANADDSVSITNTAVQAIVTVTDADSDPATSSVNIGSQLQFQDSGPVMTAAQNINIENDATPTFTGNFAFNLGADNGPTNNDVIKTVVATFTVNGDPVTNPQFTAGTEDANSATYNFSFDYDTGAGGIAHETGTLVFNKAAGTYTVTLDDPISGFTTVSTSDASTTFQEFDLNGGAPEIVNAQLATNLFAQFTAVARPNGGANHLSTTVGGDAAWNPGEFFNAAQGNPQVSSTDAGVNGNTMDTGEALKFNLYNTDPGGVVGGTPTAHASDMFIQFFQYAGDDLIIILNLGRDSNNDGTLDTFTTRAVMVSATDVFVSGNAADTAEVAGTAYAGLVAGLGNQDALLVIEANDYNAAGEDWVIVGGQIVTDEDTVTGTAIDLNKALGTDGASDRNGDGSFTSTGVPATDELDNFSEDTDVSGVKITSIGFLVENSEDQVAHMQFDVTVQDGDGDTITQTITVDVTDDPNSASAATIPAANTAVVPVVLDLNGDGVHFLGTDAGVRFDYGNGAVATAWAGADDGILVRDANGNGTVDGASEFVFGGNGQTDLQALAAQYGATLDANDADFSKFGVWQDANSNGVVDAGEFASLTARGITSINLTSDGAGYSAAGGDVQVAGSGTYVRSDGSHGSFADAAFLTGDRAASEQRDLSSSGSTIAIAAAVAAAGLAASQAGAAPSDSHADQAQDTPAAAAAASVAPAASDDSADASHSALSNETKEAANDEAPASSSSSSADDGDAHHSLDDSHASAPASSNEAAANDDQGPADASADASPVAPAVAMVSAEALQAAGLDGNVQHDGSVEKIIVEALGHGGDNGAVDALLDAFHGGNGGGQAIANLASSPAGGVSAWDMASNGGSTGANEMLMKVGAEMLHHDAVQPTHNG